MPYDTYGSLAQFLFDLEHFWNLIPRQDQEQEQQQQQQSFF